MEPKTKTCDPWSLYFDPYPYRLRAGHTPLHLFFFYVDPKQDGRSLERPQQLGFRIVSSVRIGPPMLRSLGSPFEGPLFWVHSNLHGRKFLN